MLKHASNVPGSALEIEKVFLEAGFREYVFKTLLIDSKTVMELIKEGLVDGVSLTGSTGAGSEVGKLTGEAIKPQVLELGGSDPFIVLEDADIESAVNGILLSIFSASGQSCVAGSRLLLHESIKDEVLSRVTDKARQIRIGDPLDDASQMGPLATEAQLTNIKSTLADADVQGARILFGGNTPPGLDTGWYIEPTVVDCPTQDIGVVRNELFGPVVSALTFRSEEEALRIANDTNFGLASGIFTRDVGRALRVSKAIRAGIVWVNTYRAVSPVAPFGGFKDSGYGRESGMEAIYDYTRPKTVWLNTSADPIADPFVMQ